MFIYIVTHIACVENQQESNTPLSIEAVLPSSPTVSVVISIFGQGFGIQGRDDQVTLSGQALEIYYWQNDRIDCRLPVDQSGERLLVIQANGFTSSAYPITITAEQLSSDPQLTVDMTTTDPEL